MANLLFKTLARITAALGLLAAPSAHAQPGVSGMMLAARAAPISAIAIGGDLDCSALGVNGGTSANLNTAGASMSLFVLASYFVPGALTVTNSASDTVTAGTGINGSEPRIQPFYVVSPTSSASYTFTQATSGTYSSECHFTLANTKTASPADQHAESNTVVGSTINAGSVTPTENNEFILTCASITSAAPPTVPSGYTLFPHPIAFAGGASEGIVCAYKIQTTASAEDPQWVWSGGGGGVAFNLTIKHS